jgi:signal transduction histidine kinase/ActR/RegA family two-component response regulator
MVNCYGGFRVQSPFLIMPIEFALIVLAFVVAAFSIVCIRLYLSLRKVTDDRSELLATTKNMEATIKAKSEFLAAMSHEIRTPMNALTSFTEILTQRSLQNCGSELKEETEGILEIIKKSSRDLLNIINDVFDYIKIDANLLEIESVPMSMMQVIHDICHAERPNVIAKHLDLSIKCSGEIPTTVLSDPVRIRQILSNLVSNAIKFTEKGTITVLCEAIKDSDSDTVEQNSETLSKEVKKKQPNSFSASSAQLKISVIDTGIGISQSHIQELFKPFRHVDSSVPQSKRGAGLGLNIAMRLATLMDGTIKVESVLGQGSTFSLLLNVYVPEGTPPPFKEQAKGSESRFGSRLHAGFNIVVPTKKPDAALQADKGRPLRNIRVLVVEDMAVNQVIIATLLRDAGAQVELADNGAMGVQKVMQDMDNGLVFDVILMDMQMPVMDGYEATVYLRKHDYSRPIIAVTAHALTGDREKTIKAGCDDYIAKPIDNRTLIEMIKKHVGVD